MRQADRDEFWALCRASSGLCMRRGLAISAACYTGFVDDAPACMFGVSPLSILSGIGVPWLVGTNKLRRWSAQKALLSEAEPVVQHFLTLFPLLVNVVDERNTSARRWLARLGFDFGDPSPMGPDNLLFRPFYLRA